MQVGDADALALKLARFDEAKQVFEIGSWSMRQFSQLSQKHCSAFDGAECEFQPDKGVCNDLMVQEQLLEFRFRLAQVVDPDRGVNKDHSADLLRGAAVAFGSLPPRAASLRAASRWTSCRSASLTRAAFSVMAVYCSAWRIRSSSRAMVVRMGTSLVLIVASVRC